MYYKIFNYEEVLRYIQEITNFANKICQYLHKSINNNSSNNNKTQYKLYIENIIKELNNFKCIYNNIYTKLNQEKIHQENEHEYTLEKVLKIKY